MLGLGLSLDLATCVSGGSSPFLPTNLSGCVLWLRADRGFSAGSWTDQSSTGAVLAPSGTAPVQNSSSINGNPGITFSGSESLTVATVAAWNLSAYTMYAVIKPSASFQAYGVVMADIINSGWAAGWGFTGIGSAGSVANWSGSYSYGATCGSIVSGTGYCLRGEFTGTSSTAYLNGTSGGSSATATEINPTSGTLNIGNAAGGEPFTGDIDELIVFNRVLASGELTQMSSYLNARYGIPG